MFILWIPKPNFMEFRHCLFKILKKPKHRGRTDNVKRAYPHKHSLSGGGAIKVRVWLSTHRWKFKTYWNLNWIILCYIKINTLSENRQFTEYLIERRRCLIFAHLFLKYLSIGWAKAADLWEEPPVPLQTEHVFLSCGPSEAWTYVVINDKTMSFLTADYYDRFT